MLDLASGTTVYLACGATDLRKSYHGLAAVVKLKFHLDPHSRCMFAFCNRRCSHTDVKKQPVKRSRIFLLLKRQRSLNIKLEGEDRFCPDCGAKYKVVTTEKVKYLKFVPARFEAVEEVTYVYSCPKCGSMRRPQKKPALLKGSVATPSLVAGIMDAKYVNGMPLARQEREFARYNLNLSAKTMANWIILCAERYLQPVYDLMKEEFLRSRYIHCDETRIQVIDEPGQKGSTQNRMWVYLTDEYSGSPRMVLFQYERTRGRYHPLEFLGDEFHGYLTCDGYQAYHSLPECITVTGSWHTQGGVLMKPLPL